MKILAPLNMRVQRVPESSPIKLMSLELWVEERGLTPHIDVLTMFRDQIDKQLEEEEEK